MKPDCLRASVNVRASLGAKQPKPSPIQLCRRVSNSGYRLLILAFERTVSGAS
jgi:hypothetical protein